MVSASLARGNASMAACMACVCVCVECDNAPSLGQILRMPRASNVIHPAELPDAWFDRISSGAVMFQLLALSQRVIDGIETAQRCDIA